jgi:hypothetical protein
MVPMMEKAVKRLEFNANELDVDGAVSRDNLSLEEESACHQGDTIVGGQGHHRRPKV